MSAVGIPVLQGGEDVKDKGRLHIDEPARNLAAEVVRRQRAH